MYNWLFFKVYGYYKSKGNNDPVFNSSLLVFFAQVVHLSVLLFGALKVFNFDIPWISTDKAVNKMIFIPILYLWSVLISKFYKNKVKNKQPNKDEKLISLYQLLLIVFVIIFIPLYIGIKLSGGQIWRFD